ncbi:nucleotidyltransferase family protein [Chloroflexi bacterium TSY]|nr:nucleotidyltransferase family protein [Chloroflexi bacterium TSY]
MERAQLVGNDRLLIPHEHIADYCARWKINEFALFGSVLRDNFSPESDIDVLVTFDPSARWTLFDHVEMQGELKSLFGHDVDLVTKRAIERSRNPIRRKAILDSAQVIYAA